MGKSHNQFDIGRTVSVNPIIVDGAVLNGSLGWVGAIKPYRRLVHDVRRVVIGIRFVNNFSGILDGRNPVFTPFMVVRGSRQQCIALIEDIICTLGLPRKRSHAGGDKNATDIIDAFCFEPTIRGEIEIAPYGVHAIFSRQVKDVRIPVNDTVCWIGLIVAFFFNTGSQP